MNGRVVVGGARCEKPSRSRNMGGGKTWKAATLKARYRKKKGGIERRGVTERITNDI
jgi:hypothetical protein